MKIDRENKLQFFRGLYDDAKNKQDELMGALDRHYAQYKGERLIDGSSEEAEVVRNITYELLESQFSSYIPTPSVTAEIYSEINERNAKSIEQLLRRLRNKLPYETLNDLDERYAVIYGGSVWLTEWDETITSHNTVGDIKLSLLSPKHFVGQPYIYTIDDMDYCFASFETTRDDIIRKYDVKENDLDEAESEEMSESEETATVHVCYYKDERKQICQFIWSGDKILLDLENYYSRKKYICSNCGKRKQLCDCDSPKYELQDDEYEIIDHDIPLNDGTYLPALSPVVKDGQIVTETAQTQAVLDDGSVALDEVDGMFIPLTAPVQVPKMEQTKLPYYKPNRFPIIIRKNTSREDALLGQSDCEFIRPQQQVVNKIETRIVQKLMKAGIYPTVPDDYSGELTNGVFDDVFKVRQETYKLFGRIDLQANIQQDIAESDRAYDHAKRILGINDSYQGQYDGSATSGVAKQIQVQQATGRLDSKKRMKNAAYADVDRIIFQYYLAYADEPRIVSYTDAQGRRQNVTFNRYDFIERDNGNGDYYYNDQYLFAADLSGDVESDRQLLWNENRQNWQTGAYGNPQMPDTLLIYWQIMEQHHYPGARDMVERMKVIIQQMQQAPLTVNEGGVSNV